MRFEYNITKNIKKNTLKSWVIDTENEKKIAISKKIVKNRSTQLPILVLMTLKTAHTKIHFKILTIKENFA